MIPEKVLVCSSLIEPLRRTINDGYQGKSFRGREILSWILLLWYALMLPYKKVLPVLYSTSKF
jgi:hypothetical protein